jgi:hypothetical protein
MPLDQKLQPVLRYEPATLLPARALCSAAGVAHYVCACETWIDGPVIHADCARVIFRSAAATAGGSGQLLRCRLSQHGEALILQHQCARRSLEAQDLRLARRCHDLAPRFVVVDSLQCPIRRPPSFTIGNVVQHGVSVVDLVNSESGRVVA